MVHHTATQVYSHCYVFSLRASEYVILGQEPLMGTVTTVKPVW